VYKRQFLNGRPVEDSAISRGLAEGFRGSLGDGLHPCAWLWIELDPALVDVNVHPAKREIRLHRPHELRETLAAAVRDGLAQAEAARRPVSLAPARSAPLAGRSPVWPATVPVQREFGPIEVAVAEPAPEAVAKVPAGAPPFRLLGGLLDRFAVLESEDGLVLLDPRAARERILYERWLGGASGNGVEVQSLLVPVLIEPGPRESELALRHREEFALAGIELEDFGSGTLRIGTLPDFLRLSDVRAFVIGLIDDLADGHAPGARFAFEMLAKILARRAAQMEAIRPQEALSLLELLFRCELPYCAPDGRPTLSEFSMRELERRFAGGRGASF
jgi:DNA mismatch repair protein MutL